MTNVSQGPNLWSHWAYCWRSGYISTGFSKDCSWCELKCGAPWHSNQSLTSQHGGGLMFCSMHESVFPWGPGVCCRKSGGVNNLLIVWPGIVIHWDLHANVMGLCYEILGLEMDLLISRSERFKAQVQVSQSLGRLLIKEVSMTTENV